MKADHLRNAPLGTMSIVWKIHYTKIFPVVLNLPSSTTRNIFVKEFSILSLRDNQKFNHIIMMNDEWTKEIRSKKDELFTDNGP